MATTKRKTMGWESFEKIYTGRVKLDPNWSKDPSNRQIMKELYYAGEDLMKMRMAAYARTNSPTENNPVQLSQSDLNSVMGIGDVALAMEENIKKKMQYHLKRSRIGRWIMEQKGLRAGWLGGVVLASLPDIYDAAICNACGRYLLRTKNMEFYHATPPKRNDGKDSKNKCIHEGTLMDPDNYHIHERKPSTFVRFSGLATVEGFVCPDCKYLLHWNSDKKSYTHPAYKKNLPEDMKECEHSSTSWKPNKKGIPVLGKKLALETRRSDSGSKGEVRAFNSKLRAKLIGPGGVAESFVRAKHPVYYPMYVGYKQKKAGQQPWKPKGWIEMMGKRKIASQFLIDLFIQWRALEGLPCRPSYAEEKLGITHHP